MITKQEYSLMSADAYNDARGIANQLDLVPLGWNIIKKEGGSTGGVFSSGLSIIAYKKGNEIVIACKGTDFLLDTNKPQTYSDLIADFGLGGSLGFSSSQLFQAALFYQRVKEQNPGATMTFTGHSLGAGLASVLSVWFDKPATIFADAPFEFTALNPLTQAYVANDILAGGSGNDTYQFTGTFDFDTIVDNDGWGSIQVDGNPLQGGRKVEGLDNVWRNEEQGYTFSLAGSGADRSLLIVKDGSLDAIRVKGWQDGQLGLTMDSSPAPSIAIQHIYHGDQRAPLTGGSYDWSP